MSNIPQEAIELIRSNFELWVKGELSESSFKWHLHTNLQRIDNSLSTPHPEAATEGGRTAEDWKKVYDDLLTNAKSRYGFDNQINDFIQEVVRYIAASSSSQQGEKSLVEKKLEFYREQTDKIRQLVFDSKEIGEPCQPIYDAVVDRIKLLESQIQELKVQPASHPTEQGEKKELLHKIVDLILSKPKEMSLDELCYLLQSKFTITPKQ
jgi:hypothetical protein